MNDRFYSEAGDFLGAETGEDLPKLAIGQVITREFQGRSESRWEVVLTVPEPDGALIVLLNLCEIVTTARAAAHTPGAFLFAG